MADRQWKARPYRGKREKRCDFSTGFDYERHVVLMCRKPAVWRLTEANGRRGFATVAMACDECWSRIKEFKV